MITMKRIFFTVAALVMSSTARAGMIQVAVSANFTAPMQQIAANFEKETGNTVQLTFGATGKFYAQIKNGAPFEVLLAADDQVPERLAKEGFGVASSCFTYAIGKLVLWSATPNFVDSNGEVLKQGHFQHIAIANPTLAPYGAAAMDVIGKMGLLPTLQERIVLGDNVAQTQQFISTGNAELGFIALSQVLKDGKINGGSMWLVPPTLYHPIRQDAIILSKGKGKPAVDALMTYLRSSKTTAIIKSYGYTL